jgi:hypothetical protein
MLSNIIWLPSACFSQGKLLCNSHSACAAAAAAVQSEFFFLVLLPPIMFDACFNLDSRL